MPHYSKQNEKKTPVLEVVIDSREPINTRYTFERFKTFKFDGRICELQTTVAALPYGDYALVGSPYIVERKTLEDWISTAIHNIDRFKRELLRAEHAGIRIYIIVEGFDSDIQAGNYVSKAQASSIRGVRRALYRDFEVPVLFCGTREAAEEETLRTLTMREKRKFSYYDGGGI